MEGLGIKSDTMIDMLLEDHSINYKQDGIRRSSQETTMHLFQSPIIEPECRKG
jgi:hypothetical protein